MVGVVTILRYSILLEEGFDSLPRLLSGDSPNLEICLENRGVRGQT